jgi:hypothetical protein
VNDPKRTSCRKPPVFCNGSLIVFCMGSTMPRRDFVLASFSFRDRDAGREWRAIDDSMRSATDEGKQIGVDHVSMGKRHAVRIALVDLQRGILHQFG